MRARVTPRRREQALAAGRTLSRAGFEGDTEDEVDSRCLSVFHGVLGHLEQTPGCGFPPADVP